MKKVFFTIIILISTSVYSNAQFMPYTPVLSFLPTMPYTPYIQSPVMMNAQMSAMQMMANLQKQTEQVMETIAHQVMDNQARFYSDYKKFHPNATDLEITEAYGNYTQGVISAQNNNNPYSGSQNSSSSSTSSNSTSSRKCVYCDGTGKVYKELHVATFGLDTTKEYCSICQKSTSIKHAHINCTNCHGTGYVKY